MKVQLANPITRSTKWTEENIHDIPDAQSLAEAAYLAIRKTHDFLTEDNHRYEAGDKELEWGGEVIKYSSVLIYPNTFSPIGAHANRVLTGVDYWFAVEYREAP